MTIVYGFTLMVSIAISASAVWMLKEHRQGIEDALEFAVFGSLGFVGAGYSALQIARPVPRRRK